MACGVGLLANFRNSVEDSLYKQVRDDPGHLAIIRPHHDRP